MNEATMTDADMAQRENIVKSMKKKFKYFRKRYGANAKNVMYATATKMAMKEDLQGSSVAKVPYKEMDMDNLVQDAIKDIPEDDGPHTSSIGDMDAINFQTVAKPEDVVNQANNEGNRESTAVIATRKTGKPFKAIRSKGPKSYGPEDLSGAVASVAIGEGFDDYKSIAHDLVKKHGKNITKKHIDDYAKDRDSRSGLDHEEVMSHVRSMNEAVKDAADKGEYDYEGDMAKSSLRTIARNAEMMHDMLGEDTNLPEWVASKITLAEDYIVSAAQYMQSEMTEEVKLDEISSYTASRAADKSWFQGNHYAATNHRFNDRKLRTVAGDGSKRADGKLGDKSHAKAQSQLKKFNDYARKRRNQELVAKHPNLANEPRYQDRNPRERTEEYNATPFRNTERGVRGSKPAGQPRTSNSRQFFRPPEGFTKKGIEKGGGVKTVYHYKGKSSTPVGATMKMGGVKVNLGKTPTKRRPQEGSK